jgi:hypothetical protein
MSTQNVGLRWLNRLSKTTGKNIVRGWAHGGYQLDFVTDDHLHGQYDMKTGKFFYYDEDDTIHYSTCYTELWPEHLRAKRIGSK